MTYRTGLLRCFASRNDLMTEKFNNPVLGKGAMNK